VHPGGQAVVGTVETPGGSTKTRGSSPCKANCPCTSALVVDRGRGTGASAGHQQFRTAAAGCTAECRLALSWVTKTHRRMACIRLPRSRSVVIYAGCCARVALMQEQCQLRDDLRVAVVFPKYTGRETFKRHSAGLLIIGPSAGGACLHGLVNPRTKHADRSQIGPHRCTARESPATLGAGQKGAGREAPTGRRLAALASSQMGELTGKYVSMGEVFPSSPRSQDASKAHDLWSASAEMTGLPASLNAPRATLRAAGLAAGPG